MSKEFLAGLFRGGLIGAAAIILIVPIIIFILSPFVRSVNAWLSTPTTLASTFIPQLDVTVQIALVSLSLMGSAAYDQTLIVKSTDGELRHQLIKNWGGVYHFSLYLTGDNRIVLIGPYASLDIIAVNPLAVQAAPHKTINADNWIYLGAFSRGAGQDFTYAFFPADKMKECIALLGDNPADVRHGLRSHAYNNSC